MGESAKTNEQPDAKETKLFLRKILKDKEHNREIEWTYNIEILQVHEEGHKSDINMHLLSVTLMKVSNLKIPGHTGMHRFWCEKIHVYPRRFDSATE